MKSLNISISGDECGNSFHSKELHKHCRVCGKRFPRKGQSPCNKNCENISSLLKTCYKIDIDNDNGEVHPPQVCYGCVCRMRRISKAQGAAFINPDCTLFEWRIHNTEITCTVCDHFAATAEPGRKKKERKNRGRLQGETPAQTIHELAKVAGKSLVQGVHPSRLLGAQVQESNVLCCACKCILNTPVQLSCDHLACKQCVQQQLVAMGPKATCPGCDQHFNSTHLSKCPTVVTGIIENLRVRCQHECRIPVMLQDLQTHEESCSAGNLESPPSALADVTLDEVMSVPLNKPLSPDEEVVCTRLVKRATSGSKSLVLKTGGQVRVCPIMYIVHVSWHSQTTTRHVHVFNCTLL